jgi:hypothetical protein
MAFGRPSVSVNVVLLLLIGSGAAVFFNAYHTILKVLGVIMCLIGAIGFFLAYGIGVLNWIANARSRLKNDRKP